MGIYTVLGGQKVISGPLESRVDGSVRLVLAAPIIKDGQVIGAVTGSYAVEGVQKTLFSPYYGGLGDGFLVSYVVQQMHIPLKKFLVDFVSHLNLMMIYQFLIAIVANLCAHMARKLPMEL